MIIYTHIYDDITLRLNPPHHTEPAVRDQHTNDDRGTAADLCNEHTVS